jgi:hypothetical protein
MGRGNRRSTKGAKAPDARMAMGVVSVVTADTATATG